jgi:transcriptional regulator with XRE-family HTH domain
MHSPHSSTSHDLDRIVVEVVRRLMAEKGRTQAGLARVLGIEQTSVCRRSRWTFGELHAIGLWLGVDLAALALAEFAEPEARAS